MRGNYQDVQFQCFSNRQTVPAVYRLSFHHTFLWILHLPLKKKILNSCVGLQSIYFLKVMQFVWKNENKNEKLPMKKILKRGQVLLTICLELFFISLNNCSFIEINFYICDDHIINRFTGRMAYVSYTKLLPGRHMCCIFTSGFPTRL